MRHASLVTSDLFSARSVASWIISCNQSKYGVLVRHICLREILIFDRLKISPCLNNIIYEVFGSSRVLYLLLIAKERFVVDCVRRSGLDLLISTTSHQSMSATILSICSTLKRIACSYVGVKVA